MYLTSDLISWNGLFPRPSTNDDASDYAYLHTGKTILVTRAGAPITFALAETIHRFPARCLLLIDSSSKPYAAFVPTCPGPDRIVTSPYSDPLPMSPVFAILSSVTTLRSSITPPPLNLLP
jgi:hypothetical protein